MENRKLDYRETSLPEYKTLYDAHKLLISYKYFQAIIIIVGMINLCMLIPDVMFLDDNRKKVKVIILRVIFTMVLLLISAFKKRIKTFRVFSNIVTSYELFSLFIFLFILSQYSHPNYLIQTMGITTNIIAIYLIPNRWKNMLFVALLGSIGFFICSYIFINFGNIVNLWSVTVYLLIIVLLCSISSGNSERHQFREFVAKSELQRISSVDYLTNTANRFEIEEEANRSIEQCKAEQLPLTIVFLDVDNLKKINDQWGHKAGDSVLADLANVIQQQLGERQLLARWGGDEFLLLLPNVNLGAAVSLLERIRTEIATFHFQHDIPVTCSFGVAVMKEDSVFESLVCEADHLMYQGKEHGKNTVEWVSQLSREY